MAHRFYQTYLIPNTGFELLLISNEHGLEKIVRLWDNSDNSLPKNIALKMRSNSFLQQTQQQLDEYFAGQRRSFDVPLYPCLSPSVGTEWQHKVWHALQEIGYGQVATYSDLANSINQPKAVRAIGAAMGKNPFLIIWGCHRIVRKNGELGGYAAGLALKEHLLELEKKHHLN